MHKAIASLALFALVSFAPSPASAQLAINDSIDFVDVIQGNSAPNTCSCFCTYEGFAATLTAPEDMTIRYLYFYYGTNGFTETIFDFHLYVGDEPGTHFEAPNGDPAIGQFLPVNINSPQIIEVDVGQSGVTQPSVLAGEKFTVGFHYNYDPDLGCIDYMEPGDGHGPGYDFDGEAASGTNWILTRAKDAGGCGDINDEYEWVTLESFGTSALDFDWVIRASQQSIDWKDGIGDDDDDDDASDDDDAADDDDVADDDDAADDDDDDAAPDLVVLGITPPSMNEGTQTDVVVTGTGFDDTAQVFIGGLQASNVTFVSDQRLDAETPQAIVASDLPYDLLVSLAAGRQSTLPSAFTVNKAGGGCLGSVAASVVRPAVGVLLLVLVPIATRRRSRA